MADSKITTLTALTAADPANDMMPIVDVSDTSMAASGTTKRISINNILACSPSATLASATITGDLTVDTSTLKVDSTNNRVGIRTASPAATLSVVGVAGTGNTVAGISGNTDSGLLSIGNDNSNGNAGTQTWTGSAQSYAAAISFGQVNTTGVREQIRTHATVFSTNIQSFGRADLVIATKGSLDNNDPTEKYRIASDGVATWSNVGGVAGTAMTLNSTGLGVGASPATRLHISNSGDVYARIATTSVSKAGVQLSANGVVRSHLLYDDGAGTTYLSSGTGFGGSGQALVLQSGTSLVFYTNNQLATANMTLDASGNLLVGTTNTNPAYNSVNGIALQPTFLSVSNTSGVAGAFNRNTDGIVLYFTRNGTAVGNVSVTTGGATFNSTSDYRLKESVAPMSGGLARVNALKPSIFKWKSDGSNGEGFIAHELAEVVPAAVNGEKDALNEDGTIKAQSIDMSRIVPILVAAIKELTARVEALEA